MVADDTLDELLHSLEELKNDVRDAETLKEVKRAFDDFRPPPRPVGRMENEFLDVRTKALEDLTARLRNIQGVGIEVENEPYGISLTVIPKVLERLIEQSGEEGTYIPPPYIDPEDLDPDYLITIGNDDTETTSPLTDDFDHDGVNACKLWVTTGVGYDDTGTQILYEFRRALYFDKDGRFIGVSVESAGIKIDEPEAC